MLPILVQESTGFDLTSLLLPLALCCMLPMLFQRPKGGTEQAAESDSWYFGGGIQEAYDTIVKEVDEWRAKSMSRKQGMFSSLTGKKRKAFTVVKEAPPRLLRVNDEEVGETAFELTEVDTSSTFVKATYDPKARALIQDFKAKIPIQVQASAPNVCPSCGKEMLPEFKICPYCETKLR